MTEAEIQELEHVFASCRIDNPEARGEAALIELDAFVKSMMEIAGPTTRGR